jgi:hypothetical protein
MTRGVIIADITDRILTKDDDIAPILFSWRLASEQNSHTRFGNSADSTVYTERLLFLLDRTGREMVQKLIPQTKQELCWACHETEPERCGAAFSCLKSFLNDHCLHADYAAKIPFTEHMLFILHFWWVIAKKDFIGVSAFLRSLAQKKMEIDQMAANGSKWKEYMDIYYTSIFDWEAWSPIDLETFSRFVDTPEWYTRHIKMIQRLIAQKSRETVQSCIRRVKQGLHEKLHISDDDRSYDSIDSMVLDVWFRVKQLQYNFWQTPAPVLAA